MSLMSLGLVRGLIGQLLGTLAGMALAIVVRALLGMPALKTEPVLVTGLAFGIAGFMIGVGAVTDWVKWMKGEATPFHHGPPQGKPAWTRYFGVDYNHKVIGIQYTVTSIVLLMIGGGFAVVFRTELARSGLQFLNPDSGNRSHAGH